MATAVSICSNALLRLGADPINSFDEADNTGSNIERARLAANLWPTTRRRVLRSHPWNTAIKRVLLSPDASAPAFGNTARFQLPGDWLRTIAIGLDTHDRRDWRTENGFILADESEIPLVYVFDNDNPATYDASLVEALEMAMAAAMAYPVTKSTSLASELGALLREHLAISRAIDGQDDPPETFGDFPLRAGRSGGFIRGVSR